MGLFYEEELDANGKLVQKEIPAINTDELLLRMPAWPHFIYRKKNGKYVNMVRAVLRLMSYKHAVPYVIEGNPNSKYYFYDDGN